MIRKILKTITMLVIGMIAVSNPAQAQTNVTPNLGTTVGTPAWYTDRYAPSAFTLTDGFQGRNDVLNISITSATNSTNRAGTGQQGSFYNTQGKKLDVNTAGSWYFQADLYVDAAWSNTANGYVRSDMWATQCNGVCIPNSEANVTDYPILGFTNFGNFTGFRGWTSGGWVNFGNAVNFGSWNTLMMAFDAGTNTFTYSVNGANALSFLGSGPSTGVGNVMLQAYNFNDPALNFSGNPDYIAHWSNTPGDGSDVVPEPATMTLLATGLAGMAAAQRRKKKAQQV